MNTLHAFGGVFATRMFMARLELSGRPKLRVYEVDPTSVRVPDYKEHHGRECHPMAKTRAQVVPRQERAWFGSAERKLCCPGFAAFGGTERSATEALLRVMREHRDNNSGVRGLGEAIRMVRSALEGSNASRPTVAV